MTEAKTERVPIMWEPSLIKKIDDYRFEQRIGARAAAVRALVEKGLQATENEKAGSPLTA